MLLYNPFIDVDDALLLLQKSFVNAPNPICSSRSLLMMPGKASAIANIVPENGERLPQQQNPFPDEDDGLLQQQKSIGGMNEPCLQQHELIHDVNKTSLQQQKPFCMVKNGLLQQQESFRV